MRSLDFSTDLVFQPHCGTEVDSVSKRYQCQKSYWGVKGGRRLRLTTSRLSVCMLGDRVFEMVECRGYRVLEGTVGMFLFICGIIHYIGSVHACI
jgi:hypothetical protein